VRLLTSIVEMGQGVDTVFGTLVAERLGLHEDEVELAPPDFGVVPDSGPSVASRTSMLVGRLVQQACDDLREQLGVSRDADGETVRRRIRQCLADHPDADIRGWARYDGGVPPPWNPATFQGVSYSAFGWAAQVAEVDVDLRTGVITLRDLVSAQDVGTLLNRALATGQVQGGVAQAAGWALSERVVAEGGAMCNATLTDYLIPTSADLPPIRTAFAETPSAHGADGARGLGELPMVGAAAAIANAVADALGVAVDCLPVLPETVLEVPLKLIRPMESTGA
jgi:CO/xanthine dehydrogenase Mo-binding subunit